MVSLKDALEKETNMDNQIDPFHPLNDLLAEDVPATPYSLDAEPMPSMQEAVERLNEADELMGKFKFISDPVMVG